MVGCDSGGDDDPSARIVPGESVEGIPLGASKAEAEAVLGEFGTGCWADGVDRAWCITNHLWPGRSSLDGLVLAFIEEFSPEGDPGPGPLDAFWISAPYDGKTKEGIGIGSRKAHVHAAYGSPDTTRIHSGYASSYSYIYCFGPGRRFSLTFEEGLVTRIGIGNFKPLPEGIRLCD